MHFHDCLQNQLILHPHMQPQDIVKLCYQAAFGTEHLLSDLSFAAKYFETEFQSTPCFDGPLYEEISSSVCRINLGAWKKADMPSDWLYRMFVGSFSISSDSETLFKEYLESAETFIKSANVLFTFDDWSAYLTYYKELGMPSIHHSNLYRDQEHPGYRIVHKRFVNLIPILKKAASFQDFDSVKIISIDGKAASGKSTMAEDLKLILNGSIVHMDDFFLPPELRTRERFSEPGGNIHYERFQSEIIPFLLHKEAFFYQTFDCCTMSMGTPRFVNNSLWKIVEGAYSQHPYFGSYADIRVFSDITAKKQMERIRIRNGKKMAERFRTEWIPLEEKYYDFYKIKENSDIVIYS